MRDLLTLNQAVEHHAVRNAVGVQRTAWRERQNARLRPYRDKPDAATNREVYREAVKAEFDSGDLEPTLKMFLLGKLRNGLPFYEIDAVGNVVPGKRSRWRDTMLIAEQDAIRRGKHREVVIDANALQQVCRQPKGSGKRGPKPVERQRVVEAMRRDLRTGQFTDTLETTKQVSLAERYDCNRETAVKARTIVLSEFQTSTNSDPK